jgi:hypothetical protein
MASRRVRKQMQAIAIERVLGRRDDRAGISSVASLRAAYQSELITNKAEIEAQAKALVARFRQIDANFLASSCAAPLATDPSKTPSGSAAAIAPIGAASAPADSGCAPNERPRSHTQRFPHSNPLDRVRILRPAWPLQRRQADRAIRRHEIAGAAARARQLPEGEVVQHPRPRSGTAKTAGSHDLRALVGFGWRG